MTAQTTESLRDRLVAEIDLVDERLEKLRIRVAAQSSALREEFDERLQQITSRAERLADSSKEWVSVRIGTVSAVEDLGDAVDAVEADLDAAEEHPEQPTYRSVLDRQLRTWRSRAERLQVQEALAEMEVREELSAASSRLHAARSRALVELRHTGEDARRTASELRDDLEELMRDVRGVIDRAVDALTDRDD